MGFLLNNVAVDTVGPVEQNNRLYSGSGDCIFSFYAYGAFGGGAVILWVSPDKANWFRVRDINGVQVSLAAADVVNVYLRGGWIRAELTGSVGAVGVFALLV